MVSTHLRSCLNTAPYTCDTKYIGNGSKISSRRNVARMVARAMQSRNSKLILCPFCFFDKIDHPICLQNCFFLLAAHFAQILLSKFCQGLLIAIEDPIASDASRSTRWRTPADLHWGRGIRLSGLYVERRSDSWSLQISVI